MRRSLILSGGIHAGERHYLDEYYKSSLHKDTIGNPTWLESNVRISRDTALQEQTFPAKPRSENRKNTVYILATQGPLSHFAVSSGYIPSQHSAKPTPSRVVFLSASPGTPPLWPSIRKVLRCPPHCRDTATKLGYQPPQCGFYADFESSPYHREAADNREKFR